MSLIGKGTSSFRKKDVMEQKSIALGFKKIKFAHKATLGDTGITLTSLVTPTEMSTYGFVNPNASEIARANIFQYRNNLKLISSSKGLLVDQLSYVVSSSNRINFIDFTAEDGEIFTGYLDETPTTSLSVVDGQNIVASGVLAAGDTDFNIGMPIPINQNPSQQIGAVMVFADRGLQYRKVGNQTSGDGDYIEVPVAGGLGSLIRFDASGVDRFITVVSNGVVAERPDGSMTAMIERVQGQVDQMVPTLAALTGLPETTWQTAPNDVDLKQFGDTVLEQQAQLDEHDGRLDVLEAMPSSIINGSSTTLTPGVSGVFHTLTNNSFTLQPGTWILNMRGAARNAGLNPNYSRVHVMFGTVNGNNTNTFPAQAFLPNATTVGALDVVQDIPTSNDSPDYDLILTNVMLIVTAPITVFANIYTDQATNANARITVNYWAWRIK